jgi:RNA polymerase sigma-70 factor, ECF subfamily
MDQASADEELMMLYREGDASAFEVLYMRHKGPLYRFVLRQCSDRNTAEELFQEIWMNLIQGRERYEVKAKFTSYLYTIARNRVIDYYRKQGNDGFDADPVDINSLSARQTQEPEQQLELQRHTERLLSAIADLPALQREALLLREEAGMSLQEIATLTSVNTETVKSRLRYAVKKLHQVMKR